MHTITRTAAPARRALRFNPIAWLLKLDAAWRQTSRFEKLDDAALRDMGLTRRDRDQMFYQQIRHHGER